ncbi:hypothetical protein HDU93_007183, partial [Gonapodya sp. JEL0774]
MASTIEEIAEEQWDANSVVFCDPAYGTKHLSKLLKRKVPGQDGGSRNKRTIAQNMILAQIAEARQ